MESAHHVGRMSVSTGPDTSYNEMANHCESLLMGKQQKMSYLVSSNPRQGTLLTIASRTGMDKQNASHGGIPKVILVYYACIQCVSK